MSITINNPDELVAAVDHSLDDAIKRAQTEAKAQVEALSAKFDDFRQNHMTRMTGGGHDTGPGRIMKAVTESDGFRAAKSGRHSGAIELGSISIKALTSEQGSTDTPQSGISVLPGEVPGLHGVGRRPLRLLDVLRTIPVDSNQAQFTRLVGWNNAAAAQAGESAPKAEQVLAPELVKVDISTIAVLQVVSRQVLDDAAWLTSELDRLMRYSLADKLEADLIQGTGADFSIQGLAAQATAVTGAVGVEPPDQIGTMLASMAADGYQPDFVLVHPADFQSWRAERATDGQYVSGSWAQPAPPVMWNVPAIQSPSQTVGAVLAVHGPSAAMLDRQAPTIEMFAQDSDNVRKNLITIRAELRAGLAVFDTAGVRQLTIA